MNYKTIKRSNTSQQVFNEIMKLSQNCVAVAIIMTEMKTK